MRELSLLLSLSWFAFDRACWVLLEGDVKKIFGLVAPTVFGLVILSKFF